MKLSISVLVLFFFVSACGDKAAESTDHEDSANVSEGITSDDDVAKHVAWAAEPCSLVDDQQLSDLLPNPVTGSMISQGVCEYGPSDINLGRVVVEIFVQDVRATGCELFFSVGGFNSATPVDGIGTEARWKGDSGIKQLGVCVENEDVFTVTVYDPEQKADPLTTARDMSELVVARITGR